MAHQRAWYHHSVARLTNKNAQQLVLTHERVRQVGHHGQLLRPSENAGNVSCDGSGHGKSVNMLPTVHMV